MSHYQLGSVPPLVQCEQLYIRTVPEVNKQKRGLESTETEVKYSEVRTGIYFTRPSRPTAAPARCSMCVNGLFQFSAVAVTKVIRYSLRKHDDDGNGDVKKAISLITIIITLFCTFLYRHCTNATGDFFSLFSTLMSSLKIQLF